MTARQARFSPPGRPRTGEGPSRGGWGDPSDGLDLLAALVLADGARWGERATADQWDDARAVLQGRVPYHFLTRPRGGSKTTDQAGIVLSAILTQLPPASRCYGVAADRDQARLLLDAADGFCRRTPLLAGQFSIQAFRIVHHHTRTTFECLPADAASTWGLLPALVVVDELAQWESTRGPRAVWEAVASAVAKDPAARLVVLTTAGDPAHWSRAVLEHAMADPLWNVHEVPGPAPWQDPDRLEEQRRRLPASAFARLFLNEWTGAEDRLATVDDIRACVTLDGPQPPRSGRRYVIGLDVGLVSDRTVAAVCHAEGVQGTVPPRQHVVLDRMRAWQGTRADPVRLAEVEGWVLEAARTYRARVVLDPWQSVSTAQRLRGRSVPVHEFTFSSASVGHLATTLHVLIRDHALAIPDDPDLIEELANVRLRETAPGVLRMDHDPDRHDDRAIALAMCAARLLERRPQAGRTGVGGASSPSPWRMDRSGPQPTFGTLRADGSISTGGWHFTRTGG